MGVWLYAKYGRTGLYHFQKLMNDFFGDEHLDQRFFYHQSTTPDVFGEQVVDRYLNKSDHPLSAGELFSLIEECGLHMAGFQGVEGPIYDPRNLKLPSYTKEKLSRLHFSEQAEFSERFHCALNMHRVYLTKAQPVSLLDPECVLRKVRPEPVRGVITSILSHGFYQRIGGLEVKLSHNLLNFLDKLDGVTPNGEVARSMGFDIVDIENYEKTVRSFMPFEIVDIVR